MPVYVVGGFCEGYKYWKQASGSANIVCASAME